MDLELVKLSQIGPIQRKKCLHHQRTNFRPFSSSISQFAHPHHPTHPQTRPPPPPLLRPCLVELHSCPITLPPWPSPTIDVASPYPSPSLSCPPGSPKFGFVNGVPTNRLMLSMRCVCARVHVPNLNFAKTPLETLAPDYHLLDARS